MSWKEFFRPTKSKLITTLIFLLLPIPIINSRYVFNKLYVTDLIGLITVYNLEAGLGIFALVLFFIIFWIVSAVYYYLIVCILIYFFNKIRGKKNTESAKLVPSEITQTEVAHIEGFSFKDEIKDFIRPTVWKILLGGFFYVGREFRPLFRLFKIPVIPNYGEVLLDLIPASSVPDTIFFTISILALFLILTVVNYYLFAAVIVYILKLIKKGWTRNKKEK